MNGRFAETLGGSEYLLKRVREKESLRKIKGLTDCPEGFFEVRHLTSVMMAFFSTLM